MDEYGQIQFVEHPRYPQQHPGQRPGRTFYAQQHPHGQHPQHHVQHQPHVIYAQGPGMGVGVGGSSILGKMTTGQVIDMVAQIFAALMPLPAAPVGTSDANTDVGNLILYQGSLAQYAKRDEQVRTLGNLITKLVG